MKANKWTKFAIIPFAILLVACGSLPANTTNTTQPEVQSQPVADAPQSPSAMEMPVDTGASQGESEAVSSVQQDLTYPIVDTSEGKCYDNNLEVVCPSDGDSFYGQDAQYVGNAPRYQDNGDGTVTDLVTSLMWQQDPGEKMTYAQAVASADGFSLAGYADWRLPTIKELYSLILFDGTDVSICSSGTCEVTPFIDTRYFNFSYGDESAGERIIDSQFATSTKYVSTTMGGNETMFGVNFADGRIKGYPTKKLFYVLYVRGNSSYGQNDFIDNGNGTVTDNATGLTWTQNDSGTGMNWEAALNYCESLDYAGAADWRLPNVKELQSIVDYSRSPDTTNSAAIDPIFNVTAITNEAGQTDYPFYWSSTTHADATGHGGFGSYVSFGRALGYMNNQWMDVHGAGAQRSDPKSGSAAEYPTGHGPQGDAVRIYNYVRCVSGNSDGTLQIGSTVDTTAVTQPVQDPSGQNSQGQAGQGSGGVGQPPQEAIDACSSLSQGATCTINPPTGTLTGTCTTAQSGQLACVPAGGPPSQ